MIEKIKFAFAALQRGRELANPETWKTQQNVVNAVGGVLVVIVGLVKALGYELPISDEQVLLVGGSIGTIVWVFYNLYITTATTKKIGLSYKSETNSGTQEVPGEGHNLL